MRTFSEFTKFYFTSNQCLKGSQPKVWMTIFLCLKFLVEWTVWRCPGVPQCPHLTPDQATQQLSSQAQEPRHRGQTGHNPPPPPGPSSTSQPLRLFLRLSSEELLCLSILLWGRAAAAVGGATEVSETEEQDFPLWFKFCFSDPLSKSRNFS